MEEIKDDFQTIEGFLNIYEQESIIEDDLRDNLLDQPRIKKIDKKLNAIIKNDLAHLTNES